MLRHLAAGGIRPAMRPPGADSRPLGARPLGADDDVDNDPRPDAAAADDDADADAAAGWISPLGSGNGLALLPKLEPSIPTHWGGWKGAVTDGADRNGTGTDRTDRLWRFEASGPTPSELIGGCSWRCSWLSELIRLPVPDVPRSFHVLSNFFFCSARRFPSSSSSLSPTTTATVAVAPVLAAAAEAGQGSLSGLIAPSGFGVLLLVSTRSRVAPQSLGEERAWPSASHYKVVARITRLQATRLCNASLLCVVQGLCAEQRRVLYKVVQHT